MKLSKAGNNQRHTLRSNKQEVDRQIRNKWRNLGLQRKWVMLWHFPFLWKMRSKDSSLQEI